MKNFLNVVLPLLLFQAHVSAAEPKWGDWHLVSAASGVQVEYRTKPYVTKTATKTAVQWRVRNQNGHPVNVELSKTYRSHAETQRTEKVSDLGAGKVYDPSPDYVPGVVNNVQVAVRVTGQGEPPAKPQAALSQDQLDEIAELKRHVAAVQAQKMNPAPTAEPATTAATPLSAQVQTVSAKGDGPFDTDEPELFFGWTIHRTLDISLRHSPGVAYVSQIYQFKGKDRKSDRSDAFSAFLEANGIRFLGSYQTEFDEYKTLQDARKYWARRKGALSSEYRVVETEHVWR